MLPAFLIPIILDFSHFNILSSKNGLKESECLVDEMLVVMQKIENTHLYKVLVQKEVSQANIQNTVIIIPTLSNIFSDYNLWEIITR